MNYWKLGCRWGSKSKGKPLFNDLLEKENIVISWIDNDFGKNNIVLLTDGFTPIGIAVTKSEKKPISKLKHLEKEFIEKGIYFDEKLFYYEADIYTIKYPSFKYEYQVGISQIQSTGIITLIQKTLNQMKIDENTENIISVLEHKKQIILQGPPGTGKTRLAKQIAEKLTENNHFNTETNTTVKPNKEISISPALIKSFFKVGDKFIGKSNKEFEIISLDIKTISVKSKTSKVWKPSYNKIIKSYNEELFNIPGRTGGFKSYEDAVAKYLKEKLTSDDFSIIPELEIEDTSTDFVQLVQFHPSYTYEDFVRGIVAKSDDDNNITYSTEDKILINISNDALQNPNNNYVLIIDEINRANLSSVLGELIYALEYRGEDVNSLYEIDGDSRIELPKNLFIIGTMNTADRSVGYIDYAIRRRFAFVDVLPKVLTNEELKRDRDEKEPKELEFATEQFIAVSKFFIKNEVLSVNDETVLESSDFLSDEFKPEDIWLGHSYFIYEKGNFELKLKYEIKPILREYVTDGILKDSGDKKILEEINAL
ncbi:McrB family protein [Polaribacter sp. 11A2H]|uniref:McrB family protein n=1 Tax=Polaribacter sp. 11A2H TaxID=2687290 RepID=UPI001F0F10BE|nr:AAA family ATPase [Polaribacter sp. 11A2H]